MFKRSLFSLLLIAGIAANAGVIPRDVSLAPVVKLASPAVVNISTRGMVEVENNPMFSDPMFRDFFGLPEGGGSGQRETASLGSGVIVDAEKGHVLTNYHVVANADEITVNLNDGREFSAEVIGSDQPSDVALLKIEPDDLVELPYGSSDAMEVGDYVLALGNPFGLGHTVTSGIVSAVGRSGLNNANYEDFIQTDAAINRGNSGGALINLQGELVGINTAIIGPAGGNVGIGFAIPSRMARAVMDQILEFGEVRRGLLGVRGQELTADIAQQLDLGRTRGAVITQVEEGTGAAEAGIREFDVIVSADGRTVRNFNDLRNVIGLKRPGDTVEIELVRDGKRRTVTAELSAADGVSNDDEAESADGDEVSGLGGAQLDTLPESHPLHGEVEGVVVLQVERSSPAARAGLARGDVITSINRNPIGSLNDVRDAMAESDRYLLQVRRGEAAFFVVID